MKKFKKYFKVSGLIVAFAIFVGILAGCGSSAVSDTKEDGFTVVKVGVVGTTDNPIWKQVNKNLKSEKIKVKLVSFTDGILANQALSNGELDLTAFQHHAFLEQEIKDKGYKFSVLGNTYLVPLNVFSDQLKSLDDLKDGDKIAIPNNTTNAGRALLVLQDAGVIKLKADAGNSPTVQDITENPKNIQIQQVDPSKIMNLLPDFAAGITNTNFVQAAGKDPVKDAIYAVQPDINDSTNEPWLNLIAANTSDKNNKVYKKVVAAYQTKSVANRIEKVYDGVVTPAFEY